MNISNPHNSSLYTKHEYDNKYIQCFSINTNLLNLLYKQRISNNNERKKRKSLILIVI